MENNLITPIKASILSLFAILLLFSCKKNNDGPVSPPAPDSNGYYVLCEGNFNWGNASLSSYDEHNDVMTNNYFELVNGFDLGDVAQSITETEEHYLIVVNNSAKLEVVNKDDFSSLVTISGLNSPRYVQPINDSVVYISDLWSNVISRVNYLNGNVEAAIAVNGWAEQMVKAEDSVYVCLYDASSIGIINAVSDSLLFEIALDLPPSAIRLDKNGKLWVIASEWGGISKLYRINTANRMIENEWEFTADNGLAYMALPENGNNIYLATYIGEIYKFPIIGSSIIAPLFTADVTSIYAFNVNPEGAIFIGDAMDYVQNGKVMKYNESGVKLYSLESGINPNTIIFR